MNDHPQDLSALFEVAVEIESEQERQEFLERSCGGDAGLREQLEVLLRAHAKAGSFLAAPPPQLAATHAGSPGQPGYNHAKSAHPSMLQLIGQTVAGELPRIVLDSSPDEMAGPIVRPKSPELPPTEADGRYHLQGEIARGGMGAILKGRDTDLGRDLAVKVLLAEHKEKPAVIQRFVEEAQIGGQLQHPGIVPVYELGQFNDRRPFFTMKFVKGKTLTALLDERSSPNEDRAKFLGIFEQVCQTMAYAHSRGVIHRDLKPSNVMVGAFGEVQVMDWGLAKVLSEGGVADEKKAFDNRTRTSIIQTIRSLGSDMPAAFDCGTHGSQTQMGSVLGTPAYMPPEQALGEIDRLDQRSDVFGLGAILCEILTGSPPYVGEDHTDVFRKASRAKLNDCYERLNDQALDGELEEIVRDALQPEPEDRIRDAGILTNRINGYLESVESRMRKAELAKVEANTRATEERKRRKVMMALAASVLLTLGLAGGGYLYLMQQRANLAAAQAQQEHEEDARRSQLTNQISSELSTARVLANLDSDSTQLPTRTSVERALEAADRAIKLLSSGEVGPQVARDAKTLHATLSDLNRSLTLVADLENAWEYEMDRQYEGADAEVVLSNDDPELQEADTRAESGLQLPTVTTAEPLYERAFAAWALDPKTTTEADAVQQIKKLPEQLQPPVVVSLQRWLELLRGPRSLEQWKQADWTVMKVVDFKSSRDVNHEVLPDGSILVSAPPNGEETYHLTLQTDAPAIAAVRLEALPHESLPDGGPGRHRQPAGFDVNRLNIVRVGGADGDVAVRIRAATADHYSESPAVTTRAWSVLFAGGENYAAYFETVTVQPQAEGYQFEVSWESPRPLGRFRLSVAGQQPISGKQEWLQSVVAQADQDAWRSGLREEVGRADVDALLARAADTESLDAQPEIVQMQLATTLRRMDETWMLANHPDRINWKTVTPIDVKSSSRSILEVQPDGSVFVSGPVPLIDTYTITVPLDGNPVTAVKLEPIPDERLPNGGYSRHQSGAVHFVEFAMSVHPEDNPSNDRLVNIDHAISSVLTPLLADRIASAIDGDHSTFWDLGRDEPTGVFLVRPSLQGTGRRQLRMQVVTGADDLRCLGRFRLSVTSSALPLSKPRAAALAILERIYQRNSGDYWVNLALADTIGNGSPGSVPEALRYATAAVALRPDSAMAHAGLVRTIPFRMLDADERFQQLAIRHAKEAQTLEPGIRTIHRIANQAFGNGWRSYVGLNFENALKYYQLAIDLEPTYTRPHFCMGHVLNITGRLDEAVAKYRQALSIKPGTSAYLGLALVLRRQQRWDEAIAAAQDSVRHSPTHVKSHKYLASLHSSRGQHAQAIPVLKKVLELDPQDVGTWLLLSDALIETGQASESVAALNKAGTTAASSEDPRTLNNVAWRLATSPSEELRDAQQAVVFAEKAVEIDRTIYGLMNTLGVAYYRAGEWQKAIEALTESIELGAPTDSFNGFFLSMAHWQSDEKAQAKEWYDKALEWMQANDAENPELIRFRREAEQLLGIEET